MLSDMVKVEPLGGYRIWLRFQDRVEGEVDLVASQSRMVLSATQHPGHRQDGDRRAMIAPILRARACTD